MKENILGVSVLSDTVETLLKHIENNLKQKQKSMIIAINPEKIMKAQHTQELKELLNHATFPIPDGIGIVLASRLRKGKIKRRITGIDLFLKLCELAQERHYSIFLYGAKQGVADKTKKELEAKFPGINIVGTAHGYEKDDQKVINAINESNADILFVAKGSPLQEFWIKEHLNELNVPILQGVGGSFDVVCGNIKRAPKFFRAVGLEWFYRLLLEPARIKRQLALPKFLLKILINR